MRPTIPSSPSLPCHPGHKEPSFPAPVWCLSRVFVCMCVHVRDPVGRDYREGSSIPGLGCSPVPHLLPPVTLPKRRLGPTLLPSVSERPLLFPAPGTLEQASCLPPHSLCLGPGESTGVWLCRRQGPSVDHGPKELRVVSA